MTWKFVNGFPPWLSRHSFTPNCSTLPCTLRAFARSYVLFLEGRLYIASHQPSSVLAISFTKQLCYQAVHSPGIHLAWTTVVIQFHPHLPASVPIHICVPSHFISTVFRSPVIVPSSNDLLLSALFSVFLSFAVFIGESRSIA